MDSRISKDILKQLSEIYLKIRNTARFILGNLSGFDPNNLVAPEDMPELDRWALARLNKLIASVSASYEKYEYHTIYHGVHNFCAIDMSNFYLDIIKDRLYCDETNGLPRRSAQTVIYIVLDSLVRLLAPILAFTTEEIWAEMPHRDGADSESVLYNSMPEPNGNYVLTPDEDARWNKLLRLRTDVNKALELARAEKIIGKPLDADVTLYVDDTASEAFSEIAVQDLKMLFIVSGVNIVYGDGSCTADGDGGDAGCCTAGDGGDAGCCTADGGDAGDCCIADGDGGDAGDCCNASGDGACAGYSGTEFPGVYIAVRASIDPKCARCWTHSKDVGISVEHPQLCPRCLSAIGK
jgi:isoleucyl-tRNA synthetase